VWQARLLGSDNDYEDLTLPADKGNADQGEENESGQAGDIPLSGIESPADDRK